MKTMKLPPAWANQADVIVCPHPGCREPLGRFAWVPLPRHALVPITSGADPQLRDLAEAQAPTSALRGLLWVLPEGFVLREGTWCMTGRALRRRWQSRHGGATSRAKHRRRPTVDGVHLFGWAPSFPAWVLCPGCGRKHRVAAEWLGRAREVLARELNDTAATVTEDDLKQIAGHDRMVWLWLRVIARQLGVTDRHQLPEEAFAEAVRLGLPHLPLIHNARSGLPVLPSDFFLVQPGQPMKVPVGDPDHMSELAEATWRWWTGKG